MIQIRSTPVNIIMQGQLSSFSFISGSATLTIVSQMTCIQSGYFVHILLLTYTENRGTGHTLGCGDVSSMGMSRAPPSASVMKGCLPVARPIGHTEAQNTSSVA